MADKKITELNALTTPVGEDLFAVVDIDANETKKTTYADLTSSLQEDIVNPSTGSLLVTSSIVGNSMEFTKGDGSNYFLDLSGIPSTYGLFNQTSDSSPITGSTSESSLIGSGVGTLSVPAGGFSEGDAYHAIFTGVSHFHNNDTLRIRIKNTSGVSLADTGDITLTGAINRRWKLEIFFTIRSTGSAGNASIVTAGTFTYTKDAANDLQGINFATENNTTFYTNSSNTLEVTAQFNNAQNGIYSKIFTLTKTY